MLNTTIKISLIRSTIGVTCLAFCLCWTSHVDALLTQENDTNQTAQATQTAAPQTKSPTAKKAVDQTKIVRSIYEMTKTAKTAKQLTVFVEKCESALKLDLTPANSQYVTSLSGWALNRRGNKRLETAKQLRAIGNSQHKSAMKQAMEDFDEAVIRDATRYRTFMSRGIAFMAVEDYRKAALDFTTVIKLKTDLANGWFNRAEALYQLGQYKQAASDYGVVISMDSDDAQALTGRGHCQFELGQIEEAAKDYQRVVELVSDNESAWINLGDARHRQGQWVEAKKFYDKSMGLKKTAVGYQRMAWLHATCPDTSLRNPDKAIEFAKQAIELSGDSVTNLDTLAAAEAALGNFEVAKSTQEKVIGLVSASETVSQGQQKVYKARLAVYESGEPFHEEIQK